MMRNKRNFYLIAACDRQNGISYENDLPWVLPKEYQHFQRITQNLSEPVITRTRSTKPETFGPLNYQISSDSDNQSSSTSSSSSSSSVCSMPTSTSSIPDEPPLPLIDRLDQLSIQNSSSNNNAESSTVLNVSSASSDDTTDVNLDEWDKCDDHRELLANSSLSNQSDLSSTQDDHELNEDADDEDTCTVSSSDSEYCDAEEAPEAPTLLENPSNQLNSNSNSNNQSSVFNQSDFNQSNLNAIQLDQDGLPKGMIRNCVIMGSATWLSIPHYCRPLKNRLNLVLSRTKSADELDIASNHLFDSFNKALDYAYASPYVAQVFVVGGQSVYEKAIQMTECIGIYLTRVDASFVCDRFFPRIDPIKYVEVETTSLSSSVQREGSISYRFHFFASKSWLHTNHKQVLKAKRLLLTDDQNDSECQR